MPFPVAKAAGATDSGRHGERSNPAFQLMFITMAQALAIVGRTELAQAFCMASKVIVPASGPAAPSLARLVTLATLTGTVAVEASIKTLSRPVAGSGASDNACASKFSALRISTVIFASDINWMMSEFAGVMELSTDSVAIGAGLGEPTVPDVDVFGTVVVKSLFLLPSDDQCR
jgi:hypothetical protein